MDPLPPEPILRENKSTSAEAMTSGSLGDSFDQSSLVRQKEAELKEMQEQRESYNQMVKQLTSQREMAIKKLSDMDGQITELTKALEREKLFVETKDKELKNKRTQLQALKTEEVELTTKFDSCRKDINTTSEQIMNAQLNERQNKTKLTALQQFLDQTDEAISDIERALLYKDTIKLSALCNNPLTLPALSVNHHLSNGDKVLSSVVTSFKSDQNSNKDSLFEDGIKFDPFANSDPFEGDDPFRTEDSKAILPEDDPFNPSSSASSGFVLGLNDPFAPISSNHGGF